MLGIRTSPTVNRQKRRVKTYYVAANGNDSNSGRSSAAPWATIDQVNNYVYSNGLKGGGRVVFRGGDTFNGSLYISNEATPYTKRGIEVSSYGQGRATLQASGSGGRAATLYNQTFRLKNLKLTHPDYTVAGNIVEIFVTGTNQEFPNIQIVNCEVEGGDHGIRVYAYSGTTRVTNVLIQGNKVSKCKRYGILVNSEDTSKYLNQAVARYNTVSLIYGNGSTEDGGVGNGIVLGNVKNSLLEKNNADGAGTTQGSANNLIWVYNARSCILRDNNATNGSGITGRYDRGGLGLDIDCDNCIVERNYAFNCQGEGIFICYGNNNIVRFNLLVDCAYDNNLQGVIHIDGGNAFPEKLPAANLQIYGNTIVTRYKKAGATYDPVPIRNVLATNTGFIANNHFYSSIPSRVMVSSVVDNGLVYSGNNYYSTAGAPVFIWGNNTLNGLTNWRVNGPREKVGTTNYGYSTDPLFVNAAGTTADDFKLQGGTIPAGVNLTTLFGATPPTSDYFGNTISATTVAIGAHTPADFTPAAASATSNAYGTYLTALIARLTATYTTAELANLETFFIAANQNGALTQVEILYLMGALKSQADALLNTVSTSFNATVGGSGGVTFTANTGIKTGAASYLNTNFNPSTATKYSVNSATIAVWLPAVRASATTGVDFGGTDGTNGVALQVRYTGNLHRARLNDLTSGSPPTTAYSSTNKLVGVRRNNSANIQYLTNATLSAAQTFASSAAPNKIMYIGAYNSSTVQAYSSETFGSVIVAAALTDPQVADVYNALATLLG